MEPRFARWSLASLGGTASLRSAAEPRFARLEASENGTPSGEPSGGLHLRTDPPLKFSGLLVGSTRRKKKKAGVLSLSQGKVKEWDIKTIKDDITLYYEVKSETNAFKYNNLCIEFNYNDKPSGINATIADFWIHYAIKDRQKNIYVVFKIPTNDLKNMITNKEYHRIVQGGDRNSSSCYLFKMSLFEKYKINIYEKIYFIRYIYNAL